MDKKPSPSLTAPFCYRNPVLKKYTLQFFELLLSFLISGKDKELIYAFFSMKLQSIATAPSSSGIINMYSPHL